MLLLSVSRPEKNYCVLGLARVTSTSLSLPSSSTTSQLSISMTTDRSHGHDSRTRDSAVERSSTIRRLHSAPRFASTLSPTSTAASTEQRRISVGGNITDTLTRSVMQAVNKIDRCIDIGYLPCFVRSLSSLRLTPGPSKSSGEGWHMLGVVINKEILETILIKHYRDSTLKVDTCTKF